MSTAQSILTFLQLSEKLKSELRHSWVSSGRRESVAEHSWQMALMALLVNRHLEKPVDLEHVVKMILIHDLVEAESGDIPFFENSQRKENKSQKEQEAIEKIKNMLDPATGKEFYDLFQEFEHSATPEAKLAKALDNLEVQIQHNYADFATWENIEYDLVYTKMDGPCAHDAFLIELCEAVKSEAEEKMRKNGVDPRVIKEKLNNNR